LADPVLSAVLSGQRAIALSWTFDSNADFQVFWKSNVPAGQEYVLLATTNAFSYTTPDLEASKTYTFYVRANTINSFFYSNVVELFVSCGKGVVLTADPPTSPNPQIKTVPTNAVGFNNPVSGQNIPPFYEGANGGENLVFPGFTFPLIAQIHDSNASGIQLLVTPEDAVYELMGTTSIKITFYVQARGQGLVSQSAGYDFRFRYEHADLTNDYSNWLVQPAMAGNNFYREFSMEITLTDVDLVLLGA